MRLFNWYRSFSQAAAEIAEATKKKNDHATAAEYRKDINRILDSTHFQGADGNEHYALPGFNSNPEDTEFYGLIKVQQQISAINQTLTKFQSLKQTIDASAAGEPKDKATLDAHKNLAELRDRLRNETVALKKALHRPHLLPFFANDQDRINLARRANALQRALDARLFGEQWLDKIRKESIRDKNWSKAVQENTGIEESRAKSFKEASTIVFSNKPGEGIPLLKWFAGMYYKKVSHDDIHLTAKEICQAVDFMKNADFYIHKWEDKLKKLENDPHNAELKKYEKYKRLLEHLKFCQKYPSSSANDPNRAKNVTGEDSMKLGLSTKRFCIDCKDPDTKEAMLGTMKLYSQIVAEEKKELENEAGFGAELVGAQNRDIPEDGEEDIPGLRV